MRAEFSIDEAILNVCLSGRVIWLNNEQKVIEYVKHEPKTDKIQIHFDDDVTDPVWVHRTEFLTWEVNNKLVFKKSRIRYEP